MKRNRKKIMGLILALVTLVSSLVLGKLLGPRYSDSVRNVQPFSGTPYVVIRDGRPDFSEEDLVTVSYEYYSELDMLGRCGYAMACIGTDIMPTEERGSIGQVKPSGWQIAKYDIVDGKYLYNRCHLIGYQLTGENANVRNLITGTRYMNTEGMLPFENQVAQYVRETGNHVLYRVTPVFDGSDLVARGVQMEALSVEDNGEGVCFNVYVYNEQPGIVIEHADGTSYLLDAPQTTGSEAEERYILNTNSKKIHALSCDQAEDIKEENRKVYAGDRKSLIDQGFSPCQSCKP